MLLEVRKEAYCLAVHYRHPLFSIDHYNSSKPFATFCIHEDSFQKVSYSAESSSHDDDDDQKKMAIHIKGNRVNVDDLFHFFEFPPASLLYDDLSGLILNVKHLPVDTYHELLDDIISLSLIGMVNEIDTIIKHDVTVEFVVVVVVIYRNNINVTKKDVAKYLESRSMVLDCEEEEEEEKEEDVEEERRAICLGSGSGSVIQMDCLHQFHEKCINRWFDKRNYSCSVCRFDMATAVIESMFSKPLN